MRKPLNLKLNPAAPFFIFALMAITTGGLLSAFGAASPTRAIMWVSAFLVLVMGVGQLMLGQATSRLNVQLRLTTTMPITILYNLGALLVVFGTLAKSNFHFIVLIGSLLLMAGLLRHLKLSYPNINSAWKYSYLLTVIILLTSTAIGIYLSYS